MTNNNDRITFVYQLPLGVREKLCQASNRSRTWYELAVKHRNYHHDAILKLEESNNPTEELLTDLGFSNLTIMNLFEFLSQIPDLESMKFLKPFVNVRERLIMEKQENHIHTSLCPEVFNSNNKDLKIDSQNFNYSQPAPSDSPKVILGQSHDESTTRKIINVPPSAETILQSSLAQSFFQPTATTSKINNQSPLSTGDIDLMEVPYERLEKITENWFRSHILGEGSFGTVFHARLNIARLRGTAVAIRKIVNPEDPGSESFEKKLRDLKILSSFKNHNIVSLFAYGWSPGVLCLVYELMTKGSLEDKLFSEMSEPLTWLQRCAIAKGVARGLHYLHMVRKVPHGDIKSSNILLDKDFDPKIGDLTLPRICGEKIVETVYRIRKTRPYLPEEFFKDINLSAQMDVYCYGLVMFELATGRPVYDESRPATKYLKEFVEDYKPEHIRFLGDIRLEPETDNILEDLISIGKWCTVGIPKDLPAVVEVLEKVCRL